MAQVRPQLMEEASRENLAVAEAGHRRSGGRFGLRRAGTHADGSRGSRRHHPSSDADRRSEGRGPVRPGCGRCLGGGAQDRADSGGPGGKGDRGGIPQPADFGDGRGAQAAHVSGRGHGDAAGRAGPGRRTQPGCGHRSSGEPSAALAGFARRSDRHFGGAHSAQSPAQGRGPGDQLSTARRRGDPRARSRQDFRGGQREKAGSVSRCATPATIRF